MIGLILKDLIYMRKQAKILLILIVFYIVLFSQMKDTSGLISMIAMILVLLCSILVMNSFAYDELSKWDIYALSLPVTKTEIVLSKYLLTGLFAGVGVVFSVLVALAKQLLNTEAWVGIYAAFGVAMVLSCILIPLLFQFGVQRARLFIALIFLIPSAGFFLLKNASIPLPSEQELMDFLKFSPVLLIAVVAVSIFASCKIFRNKEL